MKIQYLALAILLAVFNVSLCAQAPYFIKIKSGSEVDLEFNRSMANLNHPLKREIRDFNIQEIYNPFKTKDENLNLVYLVLIDSSMILQNWEIRVARYPFIEYIEKVPKYDFFYTPNDPLYIQQYALPLINAPLAWDASTCPASDVVVAIIDDAVDMSHPDLINAIWTNPNEIPGNGIDDDGNGFIDDVNGWDAADNDNNPNPPASASSSYFSHGTHVAGIAGATADNAAGIASLGFNLKLMPVKIGANSSSNLTNAFGGVDYAISSGYTDVINMSWGGGAYSNTYQLLFNAGHNLGITFVAAAGNNNSNVPMYPASYNHVISVAASGQNDVRANFSNYGSTIDVTAPGVSILSTVPGANPNYSNKSGTSMASPLVASLCALMKCYNSAVSPDEIAFCLKSTAVNLDAQNPSFVNQLGGGRINAQAALQCLNSSPIANFEALDTFQCPNNSIQFNNLSFGTSPLTWSWQFPGGVPSISNAEHPVVNYPNAGSYSVSLTASNIHGTYTETKTNYIQVGLPNATISGNAAIVNGDVAFLTFNFVGSPPFSLTYSDGINSFNQSNISQNPYYLAVSPSQSTSYSLQNMSDANCAGGVSGIANIIVDSAPSNLECNYNNTYGTIPQRAYDVAYSGSLDQSYVVGETVSGLPYVMLTENDGSLVWIKSYNAPFSLFREILIADNGDLILGCSYQNNNFLTRLDANGNFIWSKQYDDQTDRGLQLAKSVGDTYIASGRISGGSSQDDLVVSRFDGNGNVIWAYRYNETDDQNYSITEDGNGGVIVVGSLETGSYDYFVTQIDVDGNEVQSSKGVDGSDYSRLYSVFKDGAEYYIGGGGYSGNSCRFFIAKLDANFNIVWHKSTNYILSNNPYTGEFLKDNFGNFYWYTPIRLGTNPSDDLLVKFDSNGNILKVKTAIYTSNFADFVMKNTNSLPVNDFVLLLNSNDFANNEKVGVVRTDSSLTSCMFVDTALAFTNANYSGAPFSFTRQNVNYSITSFIFDATAENTIVSELCPSLCDTSIQPILNCEENSSSSSVLCAGDSIQLNAGQGQNYNWVPDLKLSNSGVQNPIAWPSEDETYIVYYESDSGCQYFDTVQLEISNVAIVASPQERATCEFANLQLNVSGADSYTWTPSNLVSNPNIANPVFTGNSNTQLIVTGQSLQGCTDMDTIQLEVLNCCGGHAAILPDYTYYCIGSPIAFTNTSIAGANAVFTWDFGPGATPSSFVGASPSNVEFANPGIQEVRLILNDACGSDTTYTEVYLLDLPRVNVADDTVVCSLDLLLYELGEDPIDDYIYVWQPNLNLDDHTMANPTASITSSAVYIVEVSDPFSCTYFDTVQIEVSAVVENFIEVGTLYYCLGDTITLQVNDLSFDSIQWSTGSTNETLDIQVLNDTIIYAQFYKNDCVFEDSILLMAYPQASYQLSSDTTVCVGDSLKVFISAESPFQWSTGEVFDTLDVQIFSDTSFLVQIGNSPCIQLDSVVVLADSYPKLSVNSPVSGLINGTIELEVQGGINWLWSPSTGLSCTTCQNPTLTIGETTTYVVESFNNNCYTYDTIEIVLDSTSSCVHMPSAFSPNADGVNDFYFPIFNSNDVDLSFFSIYNRRGGKIYQGNAPWNGEFKGEAQEIGVYVYMLGYHCEGIEILQYGNLSLIR